MQTTHSSRGIIPWIGTAARLLTGTVWVVAGALKLPDLDASVRAVRAYDILPETIVPVVGTMLPILEVVIGLALLLGLVTRFSAVVSALLFGAFVIGIASVWARGIEIDCGCFGGGGAKEGAMDEYPIKIAQDVGLMVASAWLVWRPRTRLAVDNVLFGSSEPESERIDDGEEPVRQEQSR